MTRYVFFAYITGSDPLLGSIIKYSFDWHLIHTQCSTLCISRFNLKLSESEMDSGRLAMRRRAARLRATVTTNSQRGMRTNHTAPHQ